MKQIKITKCITNRDNLSLKLYFKDIYHYTPLTLDKEIELSHKIKEGDRNALNQLVQSNLRFVITVAKQYQGQGLSLIDLINEGNVGLVKAAERYNGDKGYKFISYAVWWIRQAIIQAIYNTSRTIRFPVTQITKLTKINRAIERLGSEYGRTPTMSEISQELNLPEDKINEALIYNNSCSSIDVQLGDSENSATLGDMIPSYTKTDEELNKEAKSQEINLVLSRLTNREQDILKMFFGIGMQELSLEEIGSKFGMTGERARQLKEQAIQKLRDKYSKELKEIF
jgi:RNA polymerase primary sigma factor